MHLGKTTQLLFTLGFRIYRVKMTSENAPSTVDNKDDAYKILVSMTSLIWWLLFSYYFYQQTTMAYSEQRDPGCLDRDSYHIRTCIILNLAYRKIQEKA